MVAIILFIVIALLKPYTLENHKGLKRVIQTMIITCPQCETSFSLPEEKLRPNGKTLRCSSCQHEWFQTIADETDMIEEVEDLIQDLEDDLIASEDDPLDEENTEDAEENAPGVEGDDNAVEDIPDSVKPIEDNTQMDIPQQTPKNIALIGYGTAVVMAVLILLFGLMVRSPLTQAFPAANGYYAIFGFQTNITEEALSFDALSVTVKDEVLHIEGGLLNLSSGTINAPNIAVSQLDDNQNILKSWIIQPPFDTVEPQAIETFYSEYPADPNVKDVTVKLVLKD